MTGSLRAIRLTRYLPAFDIMPVILTGFEGKHHWNPELMNGLSENIEIHRINNPLPNKYGKGGSFLYNKTSWLKNLRNKLVCLIKDIFFSPDICILWSLRVIFNGYQLIKKYRIKHILVTVGPYSPAITALILSKLTGVKYTIDFRDEWDNKKWRRQQSFIRNLSNRFWERACVRNAYAIFSVTQTMVNIFSQKYHDLKLNLLAHNGYDEIDIDFKIKKSEVKDPLIFAYAGKFDVHNTAYNPEMLLRGFKLFLDNSSSNASLYVYSDVNDDTRKLIETLGLSDAVKLEGFLTRQDVLKQLTKADFFLQFYYPDIHKEAIGIKIYDYVSLRKPILAAVSEDSEINKFLSKTNSGLCCSGESFVNIAETLCQILEFDQNYLFSKQHDEELNEYNFRTITGYIAKILSD